VSLRAAWRALVLTGHSHDDLLDGMDKVLVRERQSEEMFATVCCCWVGPDRDRITVALAGHPPPLLARAGRVEVAEVPGGPALGVYDQRNPWPAGTVEAGGPWTLLCYTDGLVEGRRAPGSAERFGIEAVVEAAAGLLEQAAGLEEVLDRLLALVHEANGGDLSDDVAILCLSSHRQGGPRSPEHPGGA
jgi:serine phosphatase RsbU (regulator of sigma subunit)